MTKKTPARIALAVIAAFLVAAPLSGASGGAQQALTDSQAYRKAEEASKDGKNYFFIGTIFDIAVELQIDKYSGELRKIEYTL